MLIVDLFIILAGIGLFFLIRSVLSGPRERARMRKLEAENKRLESDREVWVEAERQREHL